MDVTEAVYKLLDQVGEHINDLDTQERIMVLCALSEHCKAYAQTILAHEYHATLYGSRKDGE